MLFTAVTEFLLFLILEYAYIRLARRKHWISPGAPAYPGFKRPVVGGGLIFLAGILCVALPLPFSASLATMMGGFILLATVSLIDDLHPLSVSLRLAIQATAVGVPMAIVSANMPDFTWVHWPPAIFSAFFIISFMNAYNFMDGINGITSGYAIAVLATMPVFGVSIETVVPVIMAALAFSVFNFRRRSVVFSGDAGSIVMGAFIATALVYSGSFPASIIAVAVYLTDTGLTLLSRLKHRENILLSHQKHLYQLLVFRRGIPEVIVAAAYSLLQVVVTLPVMCFQPGSPGMWIYFAAVFLALALAWLKLHGTLMKSPPLSELYLTHK